MSRYPLLGVVTAALFSVLAVYPGTDAWSAREPHEKAAATSSTGSTIVRDEIGPIRDDLAPLIDAAQKKYRVPGISLVLVRGDEVLWSEGFGYADLAQGSPATPETVYRAGSLAKPFTAMAVMQLTEAGEVDIDQPLNGYLPEFSIRSRFDTTAEPITIRSVLCHHSGLPTDLNKGMWTEESYTKVANRLKEEYAAFPPNLVFSYSNVGYTLLGHLVETISQVPYADYMETRIFRPWGMKTSGMGERPGMKDLLAKGYRNGEERDLLPIRDLPAHALYTSASDLGGFMRRVLSVESSEDEPILRRESFEEMFEPQNKDVPLDFNIVNGLGWFLEEGTIPGGGHVVRHGGTTLAFSSELILLPEKGLGVAVLANGDGSRSIVSRLAEEILSRVLDEMPRPLPAGLFLEQVERDMAQPEPAEAAGNYATDFGLISIRPQDAKLCACIVEETFDLIPYPNGWFGIGQDSMASLPPSFKPLAKMRFQTQEIDGREVVVAKNGEKKVVLGEKIPDSEVPDVWLKRIGSYQVLNQDQEFPVTESELKLNNGQLCMSYKMPVLSSKRIQVPIKPISDTEAIILGLGRTRGETLRAIDVNGEERLRYSGFVGRKKKSGSQTVQTP
jgi:CubicO group peptidase (beta-lactamase class C family)